MSYANYEEVFQLDSKSQRHLLREGDSPERVWAAWSLGIEFGIKGVPELFEGLNENPDPGVRRHLLIILAGFGERDILRIFAQDDPDEYVRATACQYLIRIIEQNDTSTQLFICDRLFLDTSSIVRTFILKEATPKLLALQVDQLTHLIGDSNLEVRQYVVDYLLATAPLSQLFPGILENHISNEPDYNLRQRLFKLCLKTDEKRLVLLGQDLSTEYKIEVLQFLVDNHHQFDWKLLKPFSVVKDPRLDMWLVKLLASGETINALSWLISLIAHHVDWPKPQNRPESELAIKVRVAGTEAADRVLSCIEQIRTTQVIKLDRQAKGKTINYFQLEIDILQWKYEDDWDGDEVETRLAIQKRQQLIDILKSK